MIIDNFFFRMKWLVFLLVSLLAAVPLFGQIKGNSGTLQLQDRDFNWREIQIGAGLTISNIHCDSMLINSTWYSDIATIVPNPCDTVVNTSVESVARVISEQLEMNVFPNPTSGNVNIVINSPSSETLKIQVYDVLGLMVYQTNSDVSSDTPLTINWDLKNRLNSNLPCGTYFIRASTPEMVITQAIHYFK